jgi:acyl dehydratase
MTVRAANTISQEQYSMVYIESEEPHGALVCPALLLQLSANTKSPSFQLAPGTGSILAEATTRFHAPARVGRRLRVSWRATSVREAQAELLCHGRRNARRRRRSADHDRDLHLTFTTAK